MDVAQVGDRQRQPGEHRVDVQMTYNGNATNMEANSRGSVTPVRNAVSAATDRMLRRHLMRR
jgi:hypothetical protein